MRTNSVSCSIPHCPCLKEPRAMLCPRHFKMVRDIDQQDLLFYLSTDQMDIYWKLWGAIIDNLTDTDNAFLSSFSFSKIKPKKEHPTPLTGVFLCTPSQSKAV